MDIYAAIDLLDGKCVRLTQGDYSRDTIYSSNPVDQALALQQAGAPWLHIVDLDAAKTGEATNREIIYQISSKVDIPIQVGGGIRDQEVVSQLLGVGIARVVLGTAALLDPNFLSEMLDKYADKIAVGIDYRPTNDSSLGQVAIRGWQQSGNKNVIETLERISQQGARDVIVTNIAKDGMLQGPDLEGLQAVLEACDLDVIASGGVTTTQDVSRLAKLAVDGKTISGAIIGRALYEGQISVPEAVMACKA